MANSEDTDKMPHNAVFHQSLHCLLIQDGTSDIQYLLEIMTCDHSLYTMDGPELFYLYFLEYSKTCIKLPLLITPQTGF